MRMDGLLNCTILLSNLDFDSKCDKVDYEKLHSKGITIKRMVECAKQTQVHGTAFSSSCTATSSSASEKSIQLQSIPHHELLSSIINCEYDQCRCYEADEVVLQSFLNTSEKIDKHTWDSVDEFSEMSEGNDRFIVSLLFSILVLLQVIIILIKVFWIKPHEAFRPYNETGPVAAQSPIFCIPCNNLLDFYKASVVSSYTPSPLNKMYALSNYENRMTSTECVLESNGVSPQLTVWNVKMNAVVGNYLDDKKQVIEYYLTHLLSPANNNSVVMTVGIRSDNAPKYFNSVTGPK